MSEWDFNDIARGVAGRTDIVGGALGGSDRRSWSLGEGGALGGRGAVW